MHGKVIIGIFLPLVLIVGFVLVSNSQQGLSVTKETISSLSAKEISPEKQNLNIPLQTITIESNFILSRKLTLPRLTACLQDTESTTIIQFPVEYSKGKNIQDGSVLWLFDEMMHSRSSTSKISLDIPAKGIVTIQAILKSKNYYTNPAETQNKVYDTLALIEDPNEGYDYNYYYNNCYTLIYDENLNKIVIPLTQ